MKPLNSLNHFPKIPLRVFIELEEGQNTIELTACSDTLAIDYIEITPFEKYYTNDINFNIADGGDYIIYNGENNKESYLSYEINKKDTILTHNNRNKETISFNIQNMDFGFFNISPNINTKEFKSLDLNNMTSSNNNQIIISNFSQKSSQLWAIIPVDNDHYKIMNKQNGKCLEISKENNRVILNDYSSKKSQHWCVKRIGTKIHFDKNYHVPQNSVLETTRRISEELDFEWQTWNTYLPEFSAIDILDISD